MTTITLTRGRPFAATVAAVLAPALAALGLAVLSPSPLVVAAAAGALLACGALAWVVRRHGVVAVWMMALPVSVLLGGLGAVSVSGQNGRLLWCDAVVGLGIAAALIHGRLSLEVPRAPALQALGVFVAWGALSLAGARDLLTGLAELKEWLVMLVAFACAIQWANDGARARMLLGAVAVTGALIAAHMAYVTVHSPLGPVLAVLMKQVDLPWGRSNYLAGILILALPVSLGLMGHARSRAARTFWLALALAHAAGLVLSASKGAILALFAALALAYARGGRGSRAVIVTLIAVAAAGVAVFELTPLHQVLAYRLQASAIDYSTSERMDLYRLAVDAFVRHPLLGVGLNNFSVLSNRLRGVDTVPHNLELGFLAELGVVGLLLALAWLAHCGAAAWRARRATPPRARALGVALWAAFLAAVLHNQVESTLYGEQYKLLFALVVASTLALACETPQAVHAARSVPPSR